MLGTSELNPAVDETMRRLRQTAERALVWLAWMHGPVTLLAAWVSGGSLLMGGGLWLLCAGVATLSHHLAPGQASTRITIAAALCLLPAVLVMDLSGHAWQPDAHMLFFVDVAVTAALLDRRALLAGAAVVALHHLALNLMLPALVFPGGADLWRVGFHAACLLCEVAALSWLAQQSEQALVMSATRAADLIRAERARAVHEQTSAQRLKAQQSARDATGKAFEAKLGGLVADLVASTEDLRHAAQSLETSTARAGQRAETVAQAASRASDDVRGTADAAEGMTVAINEVGIWVGRSAEAAARAAEDARRTDAMVGKLSDSARQIGQVVQLIDSIAGQTNLLALNATIEAARAGEAGKGFAVVANEVKGLAAQTATATRDISRQIADIQSATNEAVQAIRSIAATIEEVCAHSTAVADAVGLQGEATAEIARNAAKVALDTGALALDVQEVNAATRATGGAAEQALEAVEEMSARAKLLSDEIHNFVAAARAA